LLTFCTLGSRRLSARPGITHFRLPRCRFRPRAHRWRLLALLTLALRTLNAVGLLAAWLRLALWPRILRPRAHRRHLLALLTLAFGPLSAVGLLAARLRLTLRPRVLRCCASSGRLLALRLRSRRRRRPLALTRLARTLFLLPRRLRPGLAPLFLLTWC
jgi:hypothetical protein